jgi:hypothetical protein
MKLLFFKVVLKKKVFFFEILVYDFSFQEYFFVGMSD